MTRDLRRHLGRVALTLGIAAAYVMVRHVGVLFEFTEIRVTLIWPPSGLAVGALLLAGPIALPGVALGVLAANLTFGNPLTFGLITMVGKYTRGVSRGRGCSADSDFSVRSTRPPTSGSWCRAPLPQPPSPRRWA